MSASEAEIEAVWAEFHVVIPWPGEQCEGTNEIKLASAIVQLRQQFNEAVEKVVEKQEKVVALLNATHRASEPGVLDHEGHGSVADPEAVEVQLTVVTKRYEHGLKRVAELAASGELLTAMGKVGFDLNAPPPLPEDVQADLSSAEPAVAIKRMAEGLSSGFVFEPGLEVDTIRQYLATVLRYLSPEGIERSLKVDLKVLERHEEEGGCGDRRPAVTTNHPVDENPALTRALASHAQKHRLAFLAHAFFCEHCVSFTAPVERGRALRLLGDFWTSRCVEGYDLAVAARSEQLSNKRSEGS
jgi:hypothetical protein